MSEPKLEYSIKKEWGKIKLIKAKMMLDEACWIKGLDFFMSNKRVIAFGMSNENWVDDNEKVYGLAVEDNYLFVGKLAIRFFYGE